jgi:acyl-CoA synthetase (AMP-forming)/AMP-acid ligase II
MRGGYWGEPEKTAEAIDEHGWMHTGDLATVDDEGYVRIVGRIKDMCVRLLTELLNASAGVLSSVAPLQGAVGAPPSPYLNPSAVHTTDAHNYQECSPSRRIIRGGENVFPREVEDYLYSHPAVADVSVFGVADKIMGEEIAAYIVLKEGYTAAEDEPESASAGHHHPSGHGHAGMRKGSHGHSAGPAVDSKAVAPHTIKAFCRGHIAHYKVPKYVQFVPGFPTTGSGKIQKVSPRRGRRAWTATVLQAGERHLLSSGARLHPRLATGDDQVLRSLRAWMTCSCIC